jgi:hypothetical protein
MDTLGRLGLVVAIAVTFVSCTAIGVVGPNLNSARQVNYRNWDMAISNAVSAKIKTLDVYFEHASVGSNIVDGLHDLASNSLYAIDLHTLDADMSASATWFNLQNGIGDFPRGNPDFTVKRDDFNTRMRTSGFASWVDVASFKYCYIDDDLGGMSAQEAFNSVRLVIEGLETSYPNVRFIWWTMPIQTTGNSATDAYNVLVRNYCAQNNKYLLDIADIECHCPLDNYIQDGGFQALFSGYTDDGGHLNSLGQQRVARAYWTVLSMIAQE